MSAESINNFEKSPAPNEREVLNIVESLTEGKYLTEVSKVEDEQGLKSLVLEVIGDDGDPVWYDYIRTADGGAVDVVYLDADRNPVGGDTAASYSDGKWRV